jgi:hypothetical protein
MEFLKKPLKIYEKDMGVIKKSSTTDLTENCNHCQFVLQQIK